MKRYLTIVTAVAALVASFGIDVAVARQGEMETTLNAESPSPPSVDFCTIRASRLQLGMMASEVAAIMGEASKTENYVSAGTSIQILDFSKEPIRSKITLTNGRLSGVTLDVFGRWR
jgi:hypothetical protein